MCLLQWLRAPNVTALFSAGMLAGLAMLLLINAVVRTVFLEYMENPLVVLILGILNIALSVFKKLLSFTRRTNHCLEIDEPDGSQIGVEVTSNHIHSANHTAPWEMGEVVWAVSLAIASLAIWKYPRTKVEYVDPVLSLTASVVVLNSVIPAVQAQSRVLLQAVPVGLSIGEIRADIEDLPQVVEAHHVHVWQLSDTRLVASLHVKVDCDSEIESTGGVSYTSLSTAIRGCLHAYGIHESTIQLECTRSASIDQTLLSNDEGAGSNLVSNTEAVHAHAAGSARGNEHNHTHTSERAPFMSGEQGSKYTNLRRNRRSTSSLSSADNFGIHPASFRNAIIEAARYQDEPPEEDGMSECSGEESPVDPTSSTST